MEDANMNFKDFINEGIDGKMSNEVFRMLRNYVKEVAKVDKEKAKQVKKLVTELEEIDLSLDD
jgi:hypothetical protein